ncbi:MAG TPA: cobalamin biosynthesis protein [Candidatus Binataceae bacterium]|nr:cobalamin biosynthesis protein [Candidatus Binataceae bacterium]
MIRERKPLAIYAITKHGIMIAQRLHHGLQDSDVFISAKLIEPARLMPGMSDALPLSLPMGPTLKQTFTAYDCHVFIISVGAVVRMIAPLLQDKKIDPAIVCIDDATRFAICVLSGHVGRGNIFTERVAEVLSAQAVVTTASDAIGTLTVDILGRDLGWQLDDPNRNVTRGCAAVVNAAPVIFVQETGEPTWWPLDKPLPSGVNYTSSLDGVDPSAFEILLIATDRDLCQSHHSHWANAVIYRPKSLVLGIGCDRGSTPAMVERGVRTLLEQNRLSIKCIKTVATIDKKSDEAAILELAGRLGCPVRFYSAAELDNTAGIENPSVVVKKFVGTRGVAEPAALRASGAKVLLLTKQAYTEPGAGRSMTLAVARIPFSPRLAKE